MDAIVELQYERLRFLQPSDLAPLPNAKKLISMIRDLEQTLYEIIRALPVVMRKTGRDGEPDKMMKEVSQLANELEMLLNDLESEAKSATTFFTWGVKERKLGVITTFFTCGRSLKERLRVISTGFRQLALAFAPFEQNKTIYFREKDLKNIVDRLAPHDDDNQGQPGIAVHCIVGPPGIGKTALARLAYKDARLQAPAFDVRAWILVPEKFNAQRVIEHLLRELGTTNTKKKLQQLGAYLSSKKFLFVLDHVCEIDSSNWENFTESLRSSAPLQGSIILMTMTTDAYAALHPDIVMQKYDLKPLNDDDSLSLFKNMAFPPDRNPEDRLLTLAKDELDKCKGNPGAINLLGEILRDETTEKDWETTLSGSNNPDLLIEYNNFSPIFKLCFAYCFILPKDYKVRKETLIQLWISQGFVDGETTSLETIAEKYFTKLQSHSFLLDSTDDDGGLYLIPEKCNLARFAVGEAYLLYHSDTRAAGHVADNVQHISCNYDLSMNLGALLPYTSLRTLLLVCSPATRPAIFLDEENLRTLLTKFLQLRTLSLSGLPIQTLPDSIQNLESLKFLDVSHTLIEKLPDSITSSLFTLKLNDCVHLTKLPSMENKVNLRHLDISGSNNIIAMPRGTGGLTKLHSLSNFIVRYADGSHINELRDLVNLSGKLSISGLENIPDYRDATEANLSSKQSLCELVLEWTSKFGGQRNQTLETDVLGCLKASINLEALDIICYGGTRFPEWISLSHKLVRVALTNCRNCDSLPLLGQLPLLKELFIEGMDGVTRIGTEFCGDAITFFPSLHTLEFKNMPCWEEWSFGSAQVIGALPHLQMLRLERCPKLKELKVTVEDLKRLTINECQQLTTFSLGNLSKLIELDIRHCSNLLTVPGSFPALTKLKIWGCQKLTSLPNIKPAASLLEIDIENCTKLTQLHGDFPLLKKLRITKCRELVLDISKCPQLDDFILEECNKLTLSNEVELGSLISMVISGIPNFEYSLAQLLQCLSSKLINLEISKCNVNLEALTTEGESKYALPSIQRLVVDEFPNLEKLQSLRELVLVGCEGIECFPDTALPINLKRLVIGKCKRLNSLPPKIIVEFLEVYACPSLESLSQVNLPLTSLSISECTGLEDLPAELNSENKSLTTLRIHDCNSIKGFPQDGFPRNITSLSIINCQNFGPLSTWRLNKLKCLRKFSFGGCPKLLDLERDDLPTSVACLLLRGLPRLKSLSLQNLASLDILTIRDCPELLLITEEALPGSLSCLYVSNCPIFKHRCQNEGWPKIKHIPFIEFDFQHYRKEEQA